MLSYLFASCAALRSFFAVSSDRYGSDGRRRRPTHAVVPSILSKKNRPGRAQVAAKLRPSAQNRRCVTSRLAPPQASSAIGPVAAKEAWKKAHESGRESDGQLEPTAAD